MTGSDAPEIAGPAACTAVASGTQPSDTLNAEQRRAVDRSVTLQALITMP